MCIASSVRRNGKNLRDDVKTVQILLNMNLDRLVPLSPLTDDGGIGPLSVAAIEEFQRRVCCNAKPDGRVDPGGNTLRELAKGIPADFTEAKLQGIFIHATAANVQRYFAALKAKMAASSINTNLRMAHFLAQLGHESAEFRYSEEIASGAAYEGRTDLGNTQPGDGKRFKGRGLIQLTGRANYTAYGTDRNADYTTDTGAQLIASDSALAVDVSCWFWTRHSLNTLADSDNITAITQVVNGGLNGFEDRKAKLARAKFFLP